MTTPPKDTGLSRRLDTTDAEAGLIEELRTGMAQTLHRIKVDAEGGQRR